MADVSKNSNSTPRVLIADDDPGIRRFLSERCVRMGFEVETAVNGIQALIMATRNRPDVLIVDVNMPEVDGLSICLRLLGPDKKAIEVLVVTGSSSPETVARCESFGAFYARKGIDLWENVRSELIRIFPGMSEGEHARSASSLRPGAWRRPRVLVVDDDPEVGLFLSSRIRKHGVDILLASDGIRGFRTACKEEPSVIMCDYFMPNGDASYLLARLRTTASTASIPFFVTASRPIDVVTEQVLRREICGHPGAAQIIRKPFNTEELFVALQKVCAFEPQPVTE